MGIFSKFIATAGTSMMADGTATNFSVFDEALEAVTGFFR